MRHEIAAESYQHNVDSLKLHIPKIIHQTYSTSHLPQKLERNIANIRKLNPDWQYRFYSDEDILDYLEENCSWALEYYLRISKRYGAARADLFRYLLLYREGGVYLDIKSSASKPFSQVLRADDRFILSHWRNRPDDKYPGWGIHKEIVSEAGEFQQWFIVSVPEHPFLRKVIEEVCRNITHYDPREFGVGRKGTLRLTGPIAYTRAISEVLASGEYRITDAEEELGLSYSIYHTGTESSHTHLFKNHYSKQTGMLVCFPLQERLSMCLKYRLFLLARGVEKINGKIEISLVWFNEKRRKWSSA